MKASINGVPHLSVADGWWSEGYTGLNGWSIDSEESGGEQAEAEAIYRLLEEQIVPTFYERDKRGVPVQWMAIVKQAIQRLLPDSARAGWSRNTWNKCTCRRRTPWPPRQQLKKGGSRTVTNSNMPEYLDGLPNICGSEDDIAEAMARPGPYGHSDGAVDFHRIRSAFAVALHMHQPLIPAGGSDLRTARSSATSNT